MIARSQFEHYEELIRAGVASKALTQEQANKALAKIAAYRRTRKLGEIKRQRREWDKKLFNRLCTQNEWQLAQTALNRLEASL